jgi:hypothetical protein
MSKSLARTHKIDSNPHSDDVEMLEFALPLPADGKERVRALTYLHDAVDYYIKDFCDKAPNVDRAFSDAAAARRGAPPRRGHHDVSLPQAIQIFLCFYICLFI